MVAASLRGKPAKLQKKGTATTKSHRFEGFSQRISRLKIDPIHRVRRTSFGEDGEDTASYFRAALDHWTEMNLSENFSEFSRRVNPLSESLPQILYHEEKIIGLLMEYIGKRDQLSMEPLLALMSQFARDLGVRFEKHFAVAVTLIADVAATHTDVEVIEWSFTCLAWIFKFLSRLLVPDLRQLLGIMGPYLGKERQKPFVARFAAESMSFLIRKAGLVYYKNREPLERAVSHLFQDLFSVTGARQITMYQEGLMTMFSEAIKGLRGALHSNGTDILHCLINHVGGLNKIQNDLSEQILSGVVINVIHHTSADTFAPLLEVILQYNESAKLTPSAASAGVGSRLLFVCVVTRKGSRVKEWKPVHRSLLSLLERAAAAVDMWSSCMPRLLTAVAAALQTSPMDEVLSFMRPMMEAVSQECFASHFLPFCSLFAEFGTERFHSVVLPYFQRFVSSRWQSYESGLCSTLPRLHEGNHVTAQHGVPGYLFCPESWKKAIIERLDSANSSSDEIALMSSYMELPDTIALDTEPSLIPQIVKMLHGRLSASLSSEAILSEDSTRFACGQGFLTYVKLGSQIKAVDLALWEPLCLVAPQGARLPVFLEALLAYMNACPDLTSPGDEKIEPFATALLDNLSGPSHPLRLLSLRVLLSLFKLHSDNENDASLISTAIEIEDGDMTIQSARALQMQVRKLAIAYEKASSSKWLDQLIPKFCFGLLTKKFAPLWDASCEALKTISENRIGENVIAELGVRWLQEPFIDPTDDTDNEEDSRAMGPLAFQCTNVFRVEKGLSEAFEESEKSPSLVKDSFEKAHSPQPKIPATARSQALRVFNAVPQVAEKRSRQIVPLFLSWAVHDEEALEPQDSSSKDSGTLTMEDAPSNWNLRDRKALLTVFVQFSNPKVLFRSSDVFDALLGLLTNGDSEIQKSALKSLFTWKSSHLKPYEENLLNLLDEMRFRDELAVFVNVGRDNSVIEDENRPELLQVLLRLLYGKMVSRSGSRFGQGGQEGRRKAILRTLSQLPEDEFNIFIQIAFGSLSDLNLIENGEVNDRCFSHEFLGPRKQLGLLKTIATMYETLRGHMLPYVKRSMNVILYCLVRACRELKQASALDAADQTTNTQLALLRNLRQSAIHCLELVFSVSPKVEWDSYLPVIFIEVIEPRLENFAIETAQGVSGLLRLVHTWASAPMSTFFLQRFNNSLLPKTVDTLNVESAQDQVKIYVLEQIITPLVNISRGKKTQEDEEMVDIALADQIRSEVLAPHIKYILGHLGSLLRKSPSRLLLVSAVETLSLLAPCVESSQAEETSSLIDIATFLFRQPQDRVNPKTKGDLLLILQHFLPFFDVEIDKELTERVFDVVSSMFDFFKDDKNREILAEVFIAFAKHDLELQEIAELCADLNSVSKEKLNEVDYDRRLKAFTRINEEMFDTLSAKQWRPLLYNMIYHAKDDEELAIRSSASFGLKRFVECSKSGESSAAGFEDLVSRVLLPSLQYGMRQKSEIVRAEFVMTTGYFVKFNPELPAVQDMRDLLVNDDEEASFFNNILHIQQHRRLRALRRLTHEAEKGKIRSSNIGTFFLPLIEHFVFDRADDDNSHNLASEAVTAIGALSEWLEYNQFKGIFRRYRGYMQTKPDLEKSVIRLLGQLTDALSRAMESRNADKKIDGEMDGLEAETDGDAKTPSTLAKTLPSPNKVSGELTTNFIPFLTFFIHQKEESVVSLRLPVAITTVKMLKLLPDEDMALQLPSVLLDVSSVLRSRQQESRDVARKTLSEIALILGPSYFGYILKELRGSLQRGYQRHVLSFTVHTILISTTEQFKQGDLDHCLNDLVAVVMDDIFGAAGQEKDAEDYVSKMKEVKSSKSYDSMEHLAKISTIGHLADLIRPLQTLLREKLTSTLVKKIDELLRRIGIGLLRNPSAESRDLLVFCYEVIKEAYASPGPVAKKSYENANRQRFMVNLFGPKRGEQRGTTSSHIYKLPRFALDVLRSTMNKFDSLMTANNMAGFIPIIGDAIVQAHEEVKISAFRLLSTIIKLPLPDIDKNSDVYLTEAVKLIKETPSTNTEAAQAALKLIASMLRERRDTKLKEGHLAYLLKRLTADVEEPDRQGITFNFIRAVMARKFMVPEMYELVDHIASVMVTNQTRTARDLARGVYVHFLVEYPQAKSRWTKQLSFLAKNLDYQYPEGRQSVMEAVHLLLSKTGGELAQDIVSTFFVPLVTVMANDDASECREMAGVLIGQIFSRAESEQLKTLLALTRAWLEQTENTLLTTTGLQAIRIYFESEASNNKEADARFVIGVLPHIISPLARSHESEEWEMLYYGLQLFAKLCKHFPSVTMAKECAPIWSDIRESLFYPHAWIKTCSANLTGSWLADIGKANAATGYGSLPLVGSSTLELDGDAMLDLLRASFRCIKIPGVSEELATQTVRNIIFLGRCFSQNGLEFSKHKADAELSEDSEADVPNGSEPTTTKDKRSAIGYIFIQVSKILRSEPLTTRAESLIPKTAVMKLLAALCTHLETPQLTPSLQTILIPLQHFTDPSIPPPRSNDEAYQAAHKSLVSNSHEIMDLLQKKFGTSEYVAQVAIAQEEIKSRREGRRVKRRIEAVADPERFGREKKRRNEKKKEKRKEKGAEFRDRRRGW